MSGRIYWVDASMQKITHVNPDGSEEETLVHGRETYYLPWDVAMDPVQGKVYWVCIPHDTPQEADEYSWVWIGGTYRADLDGTDIEPLITYPAGASEYAKHVAVDPIQKRIYWVLQSGDHDSWRLQFSSIGPFVPRTIGEYSGNPSSMALDAVAPIGATHAYFTRGSILQSIHLGGGPAVEVLSGLDFPRDAAVDLLEGKVYVATSDGIVRGNIGGTEREVILPEEDADALAL